MKLTIDIDTNSPADLIQLDVLASTLAKTPALVKELLQMEDTTLGEVAEQVEGKLKEAVTRGFVKSEALGDVKIEYYPPGSPEAQAAAADKVQPCTAPVNQMLGIPDEPVGVGVVIDKSVKCPICGKSCSDLIDSQGNRGWACVNPDCSASVQQAPAAPTNASAQASTQEGSQQPLVALEPDALERMVLPIKKPKGKPRPTRALPHEQPGECFHCGLAKATKKGWFCDAHMGPKNETRALGLEALACVNFHERGDEAPAGDLQTTQAPPQMAQQAPQQPPVQSNASTPAQAPAAPAAAPGPQQPPQTAAAPDPDALFDDIASDPTDPKELRNLIRDQARKCLQHPKAKSQLPAVVGAYSTNGQLGGIPDDKLAQALEALRTLPGGV